MKSSRFMNSWWELNIGVRFVLCGKHNGWGVYPCIDLYSGDFGGYRSKFHKHPPKNQVANGDDIENAHKLDWVPGQRRVKCFSASRQIICTLVSAILQSLKVTFVWKKSQDNRLLVIWTIKLKGKVHFIVYRKNSHFSIMNGLGCLVRWVWKH